MNDPRAESDADIVARVRGGQSESFAELVRRYRPALLRVARSRLGRADWAEDVVQEAFLAAFRGCASYDPRYNFCTWLWTILLNQCSAHYQRRQRSVPLEPWPADGEPLVHDSQSRGDDSPLAQLESQERSAQLERLLAALTTPQADALRLRFFGELKFHEIAQAMECSLNTAKQRVRSGLLRMAEMLPADGAMQWRADDWEQER